MSTSTNRKLLIVLSLLAAALLLLAACSPPPVGLPTDTPAPTNTPAPTDTPTVAASAGITFDFGAKPVLPTDNGRPLAAVAPAQRANLFQQPPDMAIDPSKTYLATIKTPKGDIVVELYSQQAPTAVNNFVVLSSMGFYDGTRLQPVGPPMAVLGGDPVGDGQSGPGYEVAAEIAIPNPEGTIGYLRLPDQFNPERLSSGSQFYLTLEAVPDIDGVFAGFGQVIEGIDVAKSLEPTDSIESIVISEAASSKAPTPAPLPTPTPMPTPYAPTPDTTGERPLSKIPPELRNNMFNTPPAMALEEGKDYLARISTDKGDIVVDLYEDQAPNSVNNFVVLSELGFYDNTMFHRVIEGFMAQGGDPTGTGTGGPGYQFADEIVPELTFDGAGILAMANAGPNTNGSQFFITFDKTDWLNGQHTIFGKVVEGEDVLKQITLRDPNVATTPGTMIKQITIETK